MTVRCPILWALQGIHAASSRSLRSARKGIVQCYRNVSTGYGLTIFFQICHCAELNKIVETTMPVNPYDDRKVSLLRPHGNGDLDIVRASYTRRKANVIEALIRSGYTPTYTLEQTGNPPTYILVRTRKPFHTLVWTRKPHIP